jgi:hypothetical protein
VLFVICLSDRDERDSTRERGKVEQVDYTSARERESCSRLLNAINVSEKSIEKSDRTSTP